jgi:hypothetical protein
MYYNASDVVVNATVLGLAPGNYLHTAAVVVFVSTKKYLFFANVDVKSKGVTLRRTV